MTYIKTIFKCIENDKESCKKSVNTFKVNKNDLIHKKTKFHSDSK